MSNIKMKGLLKGLRYISNMFENEKESEMEIGFPTDVKHVAHIGWDSHGPSVNSPSWMNEFKSAPEYSSAPLERGEYKDGSSVTWVSEGSSMKNATVTENASAQDVPIPKTSRRNSSTGSTDENCIREKSEKVKRRTAKNPSKEMTEPTKSKDTSQESESPTKRSEATKKARPKKSKDSVDGVTKSLRSSRRARGSRTDIIPEGGLVSKGNNDELCQTSGLNPTEGGEEKEENEKGFKEVS